MKIDNIVISQMHIKNYEKKTFYKKVQFSQDILQ